MVWSRPKDPGFPRVWRRFQGRRPLPSGETPSFIVQDIPPEMFGQVVDFMSEYFVDEPTNKAMDVKNEEASMEDMRDLWRDALKENLGLICLLDKEGGDPVIVGVNVTTVSRKSEKDHAIKITGKRFEQVINAVMMVTDAADVFNRFGVEEYLAALGLTVSRDFRGQNIGAEILKARIPLCQAVGLKLTGTVFTAIESQVLASKCGFQDVIEISYQDFAEKHGMVFPGIQTKASKYMILHIPPP